MKNTPIFIHSLFRSGSTYLFNIFRESEYGYWCYQEPLHEIAVAAKSDPDNLFVEMGAEKEEVLRHPALSRPYFKELFEAWPAWKDLITEPIIYDAYFSGGNEDIGVPYWQALSEAAPGRPVFQECRTSGRIGAIKSQMGGYHVYLWRNPWDQWWSYKVASYFDVANQLILHARQAPASLQRMIASLNLSKYEGEDLGGAFDFYRESPLSSEQSYLVFYHLWCLALHEGMLHADMLLSIDRLSDSTEFRKEVQNRLKEAGVDAPDFSDCRVPQGVYLEKEQAIFDGLEGQVHQWLFDGGWTPDEMNHIQVLRRESQPTAWGLPISGISSVVLADQVSRARQVARYRETIQSELASDRIDKINDANAKANEAESKASEAETKASEAETKASEAETKTIVAEIKASEAEALASARLANVQALMNSTSWKVTAPLRFSGRILRGAKIGSVRRNGKLLLQHSALYIARRPKLKRLALAVLKQFPSLKMRLVMLKHQQTTVPPFTDYSAPSKLTHLSPHAKKVYIQLKNAINKSTEEGH